MSKKNPWQRVAAFLDRFSRFEGWYALIVRFGKLLWWIAVVGGAVVSVATRNLWWLVPGAVLVTALFVGPGGLLDRIRPRAPLAVEFGDPRCDWDRGMQYSVRLPLVDRGEPAVLEPRIVAITGDPSPSAPIPVAWSNRPDGQLSRPSDGEWEILVGLVHNMTGTEPPGEPFVFFPVGPGSPNRHRHDLVKPRSGAMTLDVEVVRTDHADGQRVRLEIRWDGGPEIAKFEDEVGE